MTRKKSFTSRLVFIFIMILTMLWWQFFHPQCMKVDIEGSELTALPQWIESGALDKVGRLTFIFVFLHPGQWVDIHIVFIFVSGPRWNNLPWSFICRLYTNRKGTVFSSLTKCSKIIFIKHSWTGFNGYWKCCNNCTPWDSALSATKWTWRWANPSFAEIRKQVKELVFAGEEPICYKGLPCLPRSRSHERLSLELSWPELVISRQEPGW